MHNWLKMVFLWLKLERLLASSGWDWNLPFLVVFSSIASHQLPHQNSPMLLKSVAVVEKETTQGIRRPSTHSAVPGSGSSGFWVNSLCFVVWCPSVTICRGCGGCAAGCISLCSLWYSFMDLHLSSSGLDLLMPSVVSLCKSLYRRCFVLSGWPQCQCHLGQVSLSWHISPDQFPSYPILLEQRNVLHEPSCLGFPTSLWKVAEWCGKFTSPIFLPEGNLLSFCVHVVLSHSFPWAAVVLSYSLNSGVGTHRFS